MIATLGVTYGDMVVVDYMMGCAAQTGTVLRHALTVRVIPKLFVDKVELYNLELQMEPNVLRSAIKNVNESTLPLAPGRWATVAKALRSSSRN